MYSLLAFTYLTLLQADSILAKRWGTVFHLKLSKPGDLRRPTEHILKKQRIVIAAVEYSWEGKHLTSWLIYTDMCPQMQDAQQF